MSDTTTTGKDLQVAEPTVPGAGDIEGGSPIPPQGNETTSSRNTGDSVMEFNVISFCTPQGKQILHDIAGTSHSGEFTALMGPSGAGKTTLMDCIALRQRRFEGAIHLDGRSPKGDYFTQTGYVHQKEMFFSMLTSREHLTFHAINRLGGRYSREYCLKRVEEVLKEVEMVRCGDTVIGGGEFQLVKGLSGGERKRLAIGTELLSHPKILFLDEPTSGLDSVMGEVITNLLNQLASGKSGGNKRIIFCVIHTPSSRMWMSFSHVILLATGGWLAYHGSREALMNFFRSIGYSVPAEYNPADYALEVVSARPGNEVEGKTAAWVVENFQKMHAAKVTPLPAETAHLTASGIKGGSSSLLVQTKMNVWRAVTQQMREKLLLYALIGMLFCLGLVFGLLFLGQARASWRNLMGMIYALVVALQILCAMNVALHFPVEWSIFMREYYTGANALGPYFMGRTIADVPYLLLFLVMVIIPYWMGGLAADFGSFLRYCGIFFLITQAAASTGYLASSFSQNPTLGLAMTTIIATPMILFSGMLYERARVPVYLKWMQYLSIVNFGVGGLVINELKAIGPGPTQWLVLHFLQLEMDQYDSSVWALVLLAFGYRLCSFCILKLRMKTETSL